MTHDHGGQVWVGEEDETMKEGLKERGKMREREEVVRP